MDIPDIDDAKFGAGAQRISELTGETAEASAALLLAYIQGAADLALDQVAGGGSIPTSLNVSRADLFRWTCTRANRIVSEREVEILLRTPSATARSVLRNMRAMYEEVLRELFIDRMRSDATVRRTGTDAEGLTWTIEFSESPLFDLAISELRRLPIPWEEVDTVTSRNRVEVPRVVVTGEGNLSILDELGIEQPPDEDG